jgi:hypothetical protein
MEKSPNTFRRAVMKVIRSTRRLFGIAEPVNSRGEFSYRVRKEKPVEMLRELSWLSKLDNEVFQQVLDGFENRQFPEGATLLKEDDPDDGLFVVVSGGEVKIEMGGIPMDVVGTGSLIGEMSVLTGYPRSASVVAVSPVTVVWIESGTLKSIMNKSEELENSLWEFASMRFAMNLLGRREPYSQWEQNIFIQWLAAGEIKVPNENGWIDLEGKVGVLVTGTAALYDCSQIVKSPATLSGTEYVFSKEARVYVREK